LDQKKKKRSQKSPPKESMEVRISREAVGRVDATDGGEFLDFLVR
jgi:hypothetical protein